MHAKVKAISPLVAALLLIMVGIAGAVLVYLWLTGFAGKGTTIPSTMETQLKIEAAKITNITVKVDNKNVTKNCTIIYVRNTGSITIDCSAYNVTVYIYDSNTGELVAVNGSASFTCGGDKLLEPGELGNVSAIVEGLKKGKYYDVKLVVGGIEYIYPSVRAG